MDQCYYHGWLPRDDLPYLLQRDGDFLVRITEVRQLQLSKVTHSICHATVAMSFSAVYSAAKNVKGWPDLVSSGLSQISHHTLENHSFEIASGAMTEELPSLALLRVHEQQNFYVAITHS